MKIFRIVAVAVACIAAAAGLAVLVCRLCARASRPRYAQAPYIRIK